MSFALISQPLSLSVSLSQTHTLTHTHAHNDSLFFVSLMCSVTSLSYGSIQFFRFSSLRMIFLAKFLACSHFDPISPIKIYSLTSSIVFHLHQFLSLSVFISSFALMFHSSAFLCFILSTLSTLSAYLTT